MAARTALTPVAMSENGNVAEGAGTAIAGLVTNGATVADPPGPNKVFLIVNNSAVAAHNVTIRAGGSGNGADGNPAAAVPYAEAKQGDLVCSVAASATDLIGPFETDRFKQADGSLSIDFDATLTGTIWVVQLPFQGVAGQ